MIQLPVNFFNNDTTPEIIDTWAQQAVPGNYAISPVSGVTVSSLLSLGIGGASTYYLDLTSYEIVTAGIIPINTTAGEVMFGGDVVMTIVQASATAAPAMRMQAIATLPLARPGAASPFSYLYIESQLGSTVDQIFRVDYSGIFSRYIGFQVNTPVVAVDFIVSISILGFQANR